MTDPAPAIGESLIGPVRPVQRNLGIEPDAEASFPAGSSDPVGLGGGGAEQLIAFSGGVVGL
ncbi:MAG: hypothetical protein ACR2P2_18370 [Nakamurella sp.]